LPYLHDRITNVVYDLNNQPIMYHTWFAREYGDGRGRHTERIDRVFEDFNYSASDLPSAFLYKDWLFPAKNRWRKFKKHTRKRLVSFSFISKF
jgi:hypothetical protein